MTAALALLAPAAADAAEPCPGARPPTTVLSGQGVLESVIADRRGIFYTDSSAAALMLLERPGAAPRRVAPLPKPGGLLLADDGDVIAGSGNGFQEGAAGNVIGLAKLLRIDPATGETTTYAEGLSMANGLAWGPDGEIYASDDAGLKGIDRVEPDGTVTRGWASVVSPNGLAVDRKGRYLYAAQTFQPAAIQRVDLSDPARVEPYAAASGTDMTGGPDGMTIDQQDRLYVAVNAAGQVWRVDGPGAICTLASGFSLTSALGFGGGGAFKRTSLFVVGFDGALREIPDARPAPPPGTSVVPAGRPPRAELLLAISPRVVRAGRRTRFTLTATRRIGRFVSPLARARLRFAGRTVRTDSRGRARVVARLRKGRHVARYRGRGNTDTATVRAR